MTALHVGHPPFTLVLTQVVPGYDSEVADAMTTHFAGRGQSQHDIRKYIYFAFSEYDVLAIVPLSEEGSLDRLTTFGHNYVRDLQQVLCFPWTVGVARPGDFQPGSALTLTFFKLDEELLGQEGIDAEYDAVHWLQDQIRDARRQQEYRAAALDGLVLGTLGWPELLLMLTGNDLSMLLGVVRDLAIAPVKRRGKSPLRFTFSHTLPCIRWDGSTERFSTESVGGQVYCQVMVSAPPGHLGHVIRKVRSLSPDADLPADAEEEHKPSVLLWDSWVTFGRRDLLIRPRDHRPVSVNQVVQLLSVLRSRSPARQIVDGEEPRNEISGPFVTATHTLLSVRMPEEALSGVDHLRSPRQFLERVAQPARQIWSRVESLLPFSSRRRLARGREGVGEQDGLEALSWVLDAIKEFENWERRLGNPGLAHAGRLRQMVFRYQAVQAIPELQGVVDDMTEVLTRAVEDAIFLPRSIPLPPIPIVTP